MTIDDAKAKVREQYAVNSHAPVQSLPPSDDAKAKVREQYASVGDAYVRSVGHATGNDLQRMVDVAAPQPTVTLLDIATGGGHVAKAFAPFVSKVIASDLTPEILTHAETFLRESGIDNFEILVADAEDVPLPDASVELVTCRIAPHHFPNPDRFVNEAARVLRPGGRFVLIDSTVEEGEAGTFFNRFEKLRDPSHVRSLTIDEWQTLIAASGLTVTLTETFPKRHDFFDWTSRSRMSDSARNELEQMLLSAQAPIRFAHNVEIESGHVVAFTDTKTLFFASK
jgi:ubiquinone/menaquinone biosynthesis C-methylase UbiE